MKAAKKKSKPFEGRRTIDQPARSILSPAAAWPFPSAEDRTKVAAPPQSVTIEPQNVIEAEQRKRDGGGKFRKGKR